MRSNIEDVECIFQTRTERAVCVRRDEKDKEDIWFPLSLVEVSGEMSRGKIVTITAPESILQEKGLI